MQITDTIADLLTRIRNASMARHLFVEIPASKLKKEIVKILFEEGYIRKYVFFNDGKQGVLKITLKYDEKKIPAITGIKRVSKPGLRIHTNVVDMPVIMKGLGTVVVSTPKGVLTGRAAKKERVGGEVLAYVW